MVTRVTDLRNAGDYASLDDRMLVLDFQAGQPEAFVEIHKRYSPLARHVCLRFLPNRHDADEAFQETMIRVFQGLHRFNGRYALQPWIARIATNVSLDHIRTRARRPQFDDESIDEHERRDPADGPEEAIERLIERDLVLSVLSGLPDSHRTALVLRELEGRSHKEIAQALDITPAQAKALIHRAKGSFRREWLLAVTEKGGFAAIALMPLLWLAKGADVARKVVDRVGGQATQVAQAATPEIVTSAASTPAVPMAATSMAERVVAAGVTILVAGGVTMGAATIKGRIDRNRDERAATPSAVVAPPADATTEPEVQVTPAERVRETRPARERDEKGIGRGDAPDPAEDGPPVVDPGASPSPDPSPSPEPSPPEDPTASPSPPSGPPPAPAWSASFRYLGPSVIPCECDVAPSLVESRLEGPVGGEISFRQAMSGTVEDDRGRPIWPLYLELAGTADESDGQIEFRFVVGTGDGARWYEGEGFLSSATRGEAGSVTYHFVGGYSMRPDQEAIAGTPLAGRVSASISVWRDGTIFLGSLTLLEASA